MFRNLTMLALVLVFATGCVSAGHRTERMARTEKLAYSMIILDAGLTVAALATTDLREGGLAHRWTDDDATAIASVVVVNVVLVYALRRAHRRHPAWHGWRSLDLGISIASGAATISNVKMIMDQ